MKKTLGKILSVVLAMAIVFCTLPTFTAKAAGNYTHLFPVQNGRLAYYYGNTPEYGGNHKGIDIHSSGNDIIYAAYSGRVDKVANNCYHVNYRGACEHYNDFGNVVRVKNDDGTVSYYGHLKQHSIMVKVGDYVYKGQPLAYMGSSGYSTGKHLHYEVRLSDYRTTVNTNPVSGNYKYVNGQMIYTFSGYGGIKEPTITTNTATNITNNTATVSGAVYDGTATSWGFYLGTSQNNMQKYGTSGSSSMDVRTYTVNTLGELKAGTTYYYQMYAIVGGQEKKASEIKSFTTTAIKPGVPTAAINYKDVAIGDSIAVSWTALTNTSYYIARLYDAGNNLLETSDKISGTSTAFDGRDTAGEYTVTVEAYNNAGAGGESAAKTVTVRPNVTVTFAGDWWNDYENLCEPQVIGYGKSAIAPAAPEITGYNFVGWDKTFENVTEDITVNAVMEIKKFDVRFFNENGEQVGETQKIPYASSAEGVAPDYTPKDGYKLVNWGVENMLVYEDTDYFANIDWYNENYNVFAKIDSAVRVVDKENAANEGYEIDITITNNDDTTTRGRVIVALQSTEGKPVTTTESAAFAVQKGSTKSINVFVPCDSYATVAKAFVVSQYSDMIPIAQPVSAEIDQSQAWSDWSTELPPENAYETESKTEYRYKTRTETTSYETSLSGWTQIGSEWVQSGSGSVNYIPSWPSGFHTDHNIYYTYNNTPPTAYETATTKRTVETHITGYVYWHWCRNRQDLGLNYNRAFSYNYTLDYHTFHAFVTPIIVGFDYSADAFKFGNPSVCQDSYWWGSMGSGNGNLLTTYRRDYVDYKKQFTYEKWSDWSDWSTTEKIEDENTIVETRTVYRYRSNDVIAEDTSGISRNITGELGEAYAGRTALLVVYKVDSASDYTTEYIGNTTVDENGCYSFDFKLREEPTVKDGEFKVELAVEGMSNTIELDPIRPLLPNFKVRYFDINGNVVQEQVLVKGADAQLPDEEKMQVEGYDFLYWDKSNLDINADTDIYPIYDRKEYTVVFVDWTTRYISMQKFKHGDILITPELGAVAENQVINWDVTAGTAVTDDMIVTAVIEDKMVSAEIVDQNGAVLENQEVKYDTAVSLPELQEENYIFLGWRVKNKNDDESQDMTDSVIDSNVTIYPVYIFAETVDAPYSDIEDGEYNEVQTVTLSCDTEDSVIYYTTDGTDPATSDTAIEYTEPFTLDSSCQLRYIAMCLGKNNSVEVSQLFAINTGGTAYHILTIMLGNDGDGRYQALVQDGFRLDVSEFENLIEGHTFNGFYLDYELTEQFDTEVETVVESLTLYADYTPNTYSVVFKDDSGAVVHSELVEYGNAATPPTMEKDGYVFIGWNSDAYMCVTGDITLTAQYVLESEYATVRLNRSKIAIMEGCQYKLKATIKPAALSYKEVKWSTDNASVVTVVDGVITGITPGTATVTVTVVETGESASCVVTVSADTAKHITLNLNTYLDVDDEGYLRRIDATQNTVADIKTQFANEELYFYDSDDNLLEDSDLVGTGCTIKLIDDEVVLEEMICIFTGDFNCDGLINNRDVVMLNQYVMEKRTADYEQMLAVDTNGDGYVNNRDCSMLARYLVGKEEL